MNWKYLSQTVPQNREQLKQLLLENRGISDDDSFINSPHPRDLSLSAVNIDSQQMKQAAARIKRAQKQQEKVVIFGDYDADGITAASLLWLVFKRLGLPAQPFIPDRERHGYGISVAALKEIKQKYDPDLIVTVDNGIVADEALHWAKQNQVEVIVTDHHQPAGELPPAAAVVHSTSICGAAVAWFLAKELDEQAALDQLDLAGIATITDQMSLRGANRSFAKFGIEALQTTQRPGLKALYQTLDIDPDQISSYTIGFVIGPRINAVGRLEHGLTAVRLLCTQQMGAASKIARKLDKVTRSRLKLTDEQYQKALNSVLPKPASKLLFVASDSFHEGIIGLIAGKLTEKFHRPAVVVAAGGDLGKGSARSVAGIDITKLIRQAEDLLVDAGGHELAAGFSVKRENLADLQQKLISLAEEQIDPDLLARKLTIDLPLNPELVDLDTARFLQLFQPFGVDNYPPVFALEDLEVVDAFKMGREKRHLRLMLKFQNGSRMIKAVGWNIGFWAEKLQKGQPLAVAANLEANHWRGKTNLQLKIKDIKTG